ncbi:thiamine-phosphate kinase [Afifella sp. IM 167]|uniref:thiamine-phosphate kinase n=1 Tax=Afifella sp. IM 167 TaxID=2033586 RepID=UPI001CC96912|nr:thiamine-phosphate kinase [Afifella sp. IM 167]MBZ8132592.1 thiamine-phosphate kinase [Afifella sp. IM 167]
MDELSLIDRYLRPLAGRGALGLLDDAGFLAPAPGEDLVLTKDMISEGVHFLPGDPPASVARKALRVNLSDLAAKGARPVGYLMGLAATGACDEAWLEAFCEGLKGDQEAYGIDLVGGDTVGSPDRITVSVTAIGAVAKGTMVHRSGGHAGDALYVSGTIGGSAVGLALLTERASGDLSAEERDRLVARYREPLPRTALAEAVRCHASASIDISDGLAGDADKLAAASGLAATIEADAIPLDPAIERLGGFSFEDAVTGGDDYEILAAIPAAKEEAFRRAAREAGVPVARIGALEQGEGRARLVRGGAELALTRRAFVHGEAL